MLLQVFPAATDDDRILCHIVDVADSNEPGYKLRCLSGLLKWVHPTSALVAVSTATLQSQGNSTSINKLGARSFPRPADRLYLLYSDAALGTHIQKCIHL